MWVPSLCQEDLPEEGMATHSSILAWRTPMERGAWWAAVHRFAKSQTQLKPVSTAQQTKTPKTVCLSLYSCISLLLHPHSGPHEDGYEAGLLEFSSS